MELKIAAIASLLTIGFVRTLYYYIQYGAPIRLARRLRKSKIQHTNEQEPVSIIVYSKFGYTDIEQIIAPLCSQNYPNFEVIFVLNEEYKLPILVEKRLKEDHKNLYFTYYPAHTQVQSKYKLALTIGLKAAKHNCILLTQAHCIPATDRWIEKMARNRVQGIDIIVGITQYIDTKKSKRTLDAWIGNLLRIRCYTAAAQNKTFMAFGSNLMFSKTIYLNDQNIKSYLRLLHGEDDLFINQCANQTNTHIELDPQAITQADVQDKTWITHQLPSIYLDTRKHYKGFTSKSFATEQSINILFLISMIFCIFTTYNDYWGIGVLIAALFSIAIELIVMKKNAQITHQTNYSLSGLLYRTIAPVLFRIQGKYNNKRTRYE